MVIAAAGLFWLTKLTVSSTYVADVLPALVVLGLGIGFMFAPAINTATYGVEAHDAGVASASVNTAQQIGGSIGTALFNTLAASAATSFLVGRALTTHNHQLATVHSYTSVFGYTAVLFLGGAVITALLLRSGAPEAVESEIPVGL
jgi:hypothetical protein